MSDRVYVRGIPIDVVSDEEAAKCDAIVCMPKAGYDGPFTDNVEDTCCKCGATVVKRPYMPVGPKIICLPCAAGGALMEN